MVIRALISVASITLPATDFADAPAPMIKPPPRHLAAGASLLLYVDENAPAGGQGLSWDNAFNNLQSALQSAASSPVTIRVAQGTYRPDRGPGITPGNRAASFLLPNGVVIEGGYAGRNALVPNHRDVDAYSTILSGDLAADDGPDFANREENSFHVISVFGAGTTSVVDGVTITGGWADGNGNDSDGAGLFVRDADVSLRRCIIKANSAAWKGGALDNTGGNISCDGCRFEDNIAISYDGGAIYSWPGNVSLRDCSFLSNQADGLGGAASIAGDTANLVRCTFRGNSARIGAGGVFFSCYDIWVDEADFQLNQADLGGALLLNAGTLRIKQSRFQDNSAVWGGAILAEWSPLVISHSEFSENTAGSQGGAIVSFDCPLDLRDSIFARNSARVDGGACWIQEGNVAVVGCRFYQNTAGCPGCSYGSGGALFLTTNPHLVTNCIFSGNAARWGGAGACYWGSPHWVNCVFAANHAADYGGTLFSERSQVTVTNSTCSNNTAGIAGGGLVGWDQSGFHVRNSILWGNSDPSGTGEGAQLSTSADSMANVDFSCIEWLSGKFGGFGNIGIDPRFVDPDGPDGMPGTGDDNLRLRFGSPCINAGGNEFLPADTLDLDSDGDTSEFIPWDLDGHRRISHKIVDMGAYEFRLGSLPADVESIADP